MRRCVDRSIEHTSRRVFDTDALMVVFFLAISLRSVSSASEKPEVDRKSKIKSVTSS